MTTRPKSSVLVQLAPEADSAALAAALEALGLEDARSLDRIGIVTGLLPDSQLEAARALVGVVHIRAEASVDKPTPVLRQPFSQQENVMRKFIVGSWGYRSFINDRDLLTPFGNLKFGAGVMQLEMPRPGIVSGSLGGTGWSLALDGTVSEDENDVHVAFDGKGEIGGEPWHYAYRGWMIPDWPNGVDQIDAIVGSVIRVAPHSGGQARAGFIASFVAVRDPVPHSN